MEGGCSNSAGGGGGGASEFLSNLPSRGFFSSTFTSANPGGLRVYICDHDTSPPVMGDGISSHSMWGHLPLLLRANSKESVEYILQALWRTRRTGLDAADRQIFRDTLQLSNDSDLDPLLVCLRMLIRKCVYDNVHKDEIQKLFPAEVLPELQRLLTLLLQKFQKEWREDISNDQVILPRLKSMTWNMANQNMEKTEPLAVINLKLQSDAKPNLGERDVKFQLAKDTMEMMLKSMYCIRDQLSDPGETSQRSHVQNANVV